MTPTPLERQKAELSDSRPRKGDDALVAALASGCTLRDAASRAGVSERTVRVRLADPSFRARLDQARAEALDRAVAALNSASRAAVSTLEALLYADSESVRLGAAKAILEAGARMRETLELERRVAQLEELIAQQGGVRRLR
jgi:hypothetical protein